ncbi:MAG TPA: serine--tRNA ligase, partial [Cellulomonas sp.]
MIDLKLLRQDPDVVRASQVARGDDPGLVDQVLDADARRRAALTDFENLRAEQKALGKQVAAASGEEKQNLLVHTKQVAAQVKALQADADAAEELATTLARRIGNVVAEGVPAGGEDDYVVLRHEGTPRDFAAEYG